MESDHLSGKPMQFEITNHLGLRSYCGVMDFTAPDNMIVVPTWVSVDALLRVLSAWGFILGALVSRARGA